METKEKIIFGTKFYGHDSSIFVIDPEKKDIFAIQTERITRFKHDTIFPIESIKKYLTYKNIDPKSVKEVDIGNSFLELKDLELPRNIYKIETLFRKHFKTVYKKDFVEKNKEYLESNNIKKIINLLSSKYGLLILVEKIKQLFVPSYKRDKLENIIIREVQKVFPNAKIKSVFFDHEYCHALSSFFTSDFDESLLFTFDGWGDNSFSKVYKANKEKIEEICSSDFSFLHYKGERIPVSVGGIYTLFTEKLGFAPDSDEGKVEALAAYGEHDNSFLKNYMNGLATVNEEKKTMEINIEILKNIFDILSSEKIKDYKKEDLSAAVQDFLEDITEKYLKYITQITSIKKICLSGGIAANVINNLNILEKITEDIHIVPAMADDGSSQGAAIALLLNSGFSISDLFWLKEKRMPYYSTSYTKEETQKYIDQHSKEISYEYLGENWPEKIAELIFNGEIGAIFHGKMEWGPRALGNRSLIADPRKKDFRDLINKKIKRRPLFQPFCPSILLEEKDRLFEKSYNNKHMTCAFRMKKEFYNELPSAIHVDGTARAQFVDKEDNPDYYRLLKEVKKRTGFGILINTSFNKHGRTIVETPEDAIIDFLDTDMNFLFINGFLIRRK